MYKTYRMPDHRLIMLYAAFQNKMCGNLYILYLSRFAFQNKMRGNLYILYLSRFNPKLIMSHTKTNNAIIIPICPRDMYKIHMRVPTPNPGLVLESLQTGQRQKRMPPKLYMNLVNKKYK